MKKTKKTFSSKFERLIEAIENDNLFDDGNKDIVDDYESNTSEIKDDEKGDFSEDVTITLSTDQVEVLRAILSQVDGEEEDYDGDGDGDGDGDEEEEYEYEYEYEKEPIELEKEAIEYEKAPDPESACNRTKTGKTSTKTGDLDCDSHSKDTEENQYKFVKREKPQELKYKTTKGS